MWENSHQRTNQVSDPCHRYKVMVYQQLCCKLVFTILRQGLGYLALIVYLFYFMYAWLST